MDDATPGPQRMRYSFESRCRAVATMVGGMSPGAAAQAVGASRATGYRWWRRYVTAGWAGLQERPHAHAPAPAPRRGGGGEILAAIAVARDPSRSGRCWGAPPRPWARCAAVGALPPPARPPASGRGYERAQPGERLDTKKLGRFWHVGKRSPAMG